MLSSCCGCIKKEDETKVDNKKNQKGSGSVSTRKLSHSKCLDDDSEIKGNSANDNNKLHHAVLTNGNAVETKNANNEQIKIEILETPTNNGTEMAVSEDIIKPSPVKSIMKRKLSTDAVTNQPKLCSDLKRHSLHVFTLEEPDDDVFEDGVTPSANVSKNLGTPYPCKREQIPLPRWFSEEEDSVQQEIGGTCEPPATPIGRDELALKRHRFFSELLNAARSAEEHRVRFDPLGPVIAGVNDGEFCQQFNSELEALVSRLENVATKLENICLPFQKYTRENSSQVSQPITSSEITISGTVIQDSESITMSVQGFQNIIQGPLAHYLNISLQIGGDVAEQSKYVKNAFDAQFQYLVFASQNRQPAQADQIAFLQPTSQQISNIQDYREKHRTSPFFNHLSAISESIPALGWVTISPAPAPYIKEMNDAGQFYTNRVLKDWKEKDKRHVDWVKAWIETLTELQSFVKQYHTTGLVWSGKGSAPTSGGSIPPPPPPGCPPPPSFENFHISDDPGVDRSALFAEINQGENITRGLKKVTSEMQTHKNPTLRQGPVPFKPPTNVSPVGSKPAATVNKSPVFARDGKKWLIEYQKNNHGLVVDNVEMNNVVYLFKCENSTVTVKGKLNSITLDSCKKTSIVFDTLVSSLEFINCQSVQMQVFGKVATISIDKTDGCQMYLSNSSLDVEIISSKSSEMNVLVPKGNGDYSEYPIPEQYKTTIVPGKGLST
ncbi:adenylyl cyclase-associated protein 1-like, partial [Agrilus planipennis]|uniref:Adenylyl cyclase-associated protein 1-like n=1 Tax=Agrilus planipennis TaxID=224129 RepID=A0A7F5QZC3_AGRPL